MHCRCDPADIRACINIVDFSDDLRPLDSAIMHGASAVVVRALLAAGAQSFLPVSHRDGRTVLASSLAFVNVLLDDVAEYEGYVTVDVLTDVRECLASNQRARMWGLVRVITMWLLPARRRANEALFHPMQLELQGYFEVE